MKLKTLKYNLKLGALALLPFMASCSDTREGVVIDKDDSYIYVDFDGDSLVDAEVKFYNKHYFLFKEDFVENREQEFLFNFVQRGDTINFDCRRRYDNDVQLETEQINKINGKTYTQCKNIHKLNEIRHQIRQK